MFLYPTTYHLYPYPLVYLAFLARVLYCVWNLVTIKKAEGMRNEADPSYISGN